MVLMVRLALPDPLDLQELPVLSAHKVQQVQMD
jgi:hypothetical protein